MTITRPGRDSEVVRYRKNEIIPEKRPAEWGGITTISEKSG